VNLAADISATPEQSDNPTARKSAQFHRHPLGEQTVNQPSEVVPASAFGRRRFPKMLIGLEGAHDFYVSIFGGVEHLQEIDPSGKG
jgi:hypothetical protein